MENAVAELHQENNGGILVWFLEILWAQAAKRLGRDGDDDTTPPAAYYKHFPFIPHSVVFNYSHAQGWFFEPSVVKSSSGFRRIRRKCRQHLIARDIFDELTAGFDRADHHIVAQLITRQSTQALQPKITYLTRESLYQLLFHGTIAEGSVLQKFVFPQGAHKDPLKNGNSTLTISWQPSYCYVERHTNQIALDDRSYTPKERGATSEAARNVTTVALRHNSSTLHACRSACNAVAEHVRVVTGIHLRSLTCVVKITEQANEVALMFVQRAAIVENERLTPSISLAGRPVGDSDEDGEDDIATAAQRERAMELRRCGSAQRKDYLVSLLPEETADAKFDKIAPRSWVMCGRNGATRFLGRSASASLGDRSVRRSRRSPSLTMRFNFSAVADQSTSPALRETHTVLNLEKTETFGSPGTFGSFRSTSSMRGRGLANSMMREVEQDMTLKTQGTVITRSDHWNEAPTRIEVSLMRDATTDCFPMKKVAHNVAALGLREKYLASMRAASSNKR